GHGHAVSRHLPGRGGLPAQRRAHAPDRHPARPDRHPQGFRLRQPAGGTALRRTGAAHHRRGARPRDRARALAGRAGGGALVMFFRFPFMEYRLLPRTLAIGILVTTAAGLSGTLSAVRRAVRLPPAEAMRPEPPPVFRT